MVRARDCYAPYHPRVSWFTIAGMIWAQWITKLIRLGVVAVSLDLVLTLVMVVLTQTHKIAIPKQLRVASMGYAVVRNCGGRGLALF